MPKKTPASEDTISKALQAYHTSEKPNLSAIAREFQVSYGLLYGRIKGRASQTANQQANKALNPIQEKVLISWIISLNDAYIRPYPALIERTANTILRRANEDRVVHKSWVYRLTPSGFSLHYRKTYGKKTHGKREYRWPWYLV